MDLVTPQLGLIFWQLVVFCAVLFCLAKYAWKPILQALKDREKSIETSLLQAEKARNEMQQLQSSNQKLLDEARLERDKMLKAAQKTADDIREEGKKRTEVDIKRMLEEASRAIETEKQLALSEIKNQISTLSVDIAQKILKHDLAEPQRQEELVAGMIKELNFN